MTARRRAAADTLMRGPCYCCRRPMNWIAVWEDGLPLCRYCLRYIQESAYWSPSYAQQLVCRANDAGIRRGEQALFAVALNERRN